MQVSADIIKRYLKFENNPLFRQLLKIPGGCCVSTWITPVHRHVLPTLLLHVESHFTTEP